MPDQFQITIERTVFRATDSPFAVLQGVTHDDKLRTVCGALSNFSHGDRLTVTATRSKHPRFGGSSHLRV